MRLEILSPVHVGVGDERRLTGYDYVLYNNAIVVFNLDAFFSENQERASEFYEEAVNLGTEFSLTEFLTEEEITNTRYHNYTLRSNGKNIHEIHPAIKTPQKEVYIPGSSIKGAIRTALICYILSKADSFTWDKIENGDRGTDIRGVRNVRDPKRVGKEAEKVIFGCGFLKRNDIIYGDAKFDLLKFIRVTDTTSMPSGDDSLDVSIVDTLSQNRSRGLVGKGYNLSMETVKPGCDFNLNIEVNINFLSRANEMEDHRQWIGLKQKLKKVFDINAGIDEPEVIAEKVYSTIAKACNYFSERIIEKDLSILPETVSYIHKDCSSPVGNDFKHRGKKWCNRCNKGDLSSNELVEMSFADIKEFYDGLKTSDEGDFLLRLGFGVGWHSTTLGLVLDETLLKSLRESFRLGKTFIKEFPKTRRFVIQNGKPAYPLGWVKLRLRNE